MPWRRPRALSLNATRVGLAVLPALQLPWMQARMFCLCAAAHIFLNLLFTTARRPWAGWTDHPKPGFELLHLS